MVCHRDRAIYVHIPKAAGTSVRAFFNAREQAAPRPRPPAFDPAEPHKFEPPPPHLRARDYVRYGHATQEQFDSYFKFSFVRNPWDRIVSEYKFRRHPATVDFKTFLLQKFPQPEWSDEYCHVIPQYDFLHDAAGQREVDFVGKYEQLAQDFDRVCEKLGIAAQQRVLPHSNRSQALHVPEDALDGLRMIKDLLSLRRRRHLHPHYTDYYDDESRLLVAHLYQQDIAAFGYAFGA